MKLVLTAKMATETVVRNSTAAPGTEAERGLRALSIYCLLRALGGSRRSCLELARLLLLRPGLLLLSCGVVLLLLPPIGLLLRTPLLLPWSLGLLLLLLMLLSRSLGLLLWALLLLSRWLGLLLPFRPGLLLLLGRFGLFLFLLPGLGRWCDSEE